METVTDEAHTSSKKVEITFGFLYDQNCHQAMIKLGKAPFYGQNLSNLLKIRGTCKAKFAELQKRYTELVKAHSEVNDKGELVEPNGAGTYKLLPDKMEVFQKSVDELMKEKFEIPKAKKIHVSDFVDFPQLGLSASDVEALEPLLDGLEA